MPEEDLSRHEEVAKTEARDAKGHFIHKPPSVSPAGGETPLHKIENLLKQDVHYSKNQDNLLDVHVGNPLRRIVLLLEDVKKQKALTVSGKLSFSLVGAIIVVSFVTIFGITNVFCGKGIQTKQGILQALVYKENPSSSILNYIPFWNTLYPATLTQRIVLSIQNGDILHVVTKNGVILSMFIGRPVLVSGDYDACSSTLAVSDAKGVQLAPVAPAQQ